MFGTKNFTTIIMDGSNENVNREIIGIIDMITKRRISRTKCRSLDKNHPTMKGYLNEERVGTITEKLV